MSLRALLFATFTVVFAVASSAQTGSCPKKQAKFVPERLTMHSKLPCSGTSISVGGVTLASSGAACPLLATHTMDHEIEVDSIHNTMIEVTGQSATTIYHFECDQDWLLIIPWGSSCQLARTVVGPALVRYRTIPCATVITP